MTRSATTTGANTGLDQYDVVIFDCDGVLLDTNVLKNDAFAAVAIDFGYADSAEEFARWQRANFGVSRFRAFEELLSGRFGAPDADAGTTTVTDLSAAFADRVRSVYEIASETLGVRDLLKALTTQRLYVASGSVQEELRLVLAARDLSRPFTGIFGSPTPKKDIVAAIVEQELSRNPDAAIVLIGDAEADADAARSSSIDFVFVAAYSMAAAAMTARSEAEGFVRVNTLAELISDAAT